MTLTHEHLFFHNTTRKKDGDFNPKMKLYLLDCSMSQSMLFSVVNVPMSWSERRSGVLSVQVFLYVSNHPRSAVVLELMIKGWGLNKTRLLVIHKLYFIVLRSYSWSFLLVCRYFISILCLVKNVPSANLTNVSNFKTFPFVCTPIPLFEAVYCFICGRSRVGGCRSISDDLSCSNIVCGRKKVPDAQHQLICRFIGKTCTRYIMKYAVGFLVDLHFPL